MRLVTQVSSGRAAKVHWVDRGGVEGRHWLGRLGCRERQWFVLGSGADVSPDPMDVRVRRLRRRATHTKTAATSLTVIAATSWAPRPDAFTTPASRVPSAIPLPSASAMIAPPASARPSTAPHDGTRPARRASFMRLTSEQGR
ncbi:hypothetical protein [Streptomyces sp. NPDC047525]|uniref:hypothetical protein n=1 Tax=Streptomyces sp. NPDC047525 TaxID=3155264 RepID=UPI0033E2E9B6